MKLFILCCDSKNNGLTLISYESIRLRREREKKTSKVDCVILHTERSVIFPDVDCIAKEEIFFFCKIVIGFRLKLPLSFLGIIFLWLVIKTIRIANIPSGPDVLNIEHWTTRFRFKIEKKKTTKSYCENYWSIETKGQKENLYRGH